MHENELYQKLTFYIEACESGSMFPGLPSNIGVYATTAANASESSWGTYCYPDDMVNGVHLNSCLGDLYSVNWMEDSDKSPATKTLAEQWQVILETTDKSHPMKFGDFSFDKDPIFAFQGIVDVKPQLSHFAPKRSVDIDSRDAKLHYLYAKNLENPTHHNSLALQQELNHRMESDILFSEFATISMIDTHKRLRVENYDCLKTMIDRFETLQGYRLSDYQLKYVHQFVNACQTMAHPQLALQALEKTFQR